MTGNEKTNKENTIFIGKKELSAYLLAVEENHTKTKKDVTIEARGRATSKAIDVAEIAKNKFGFQIKNIQLGTDEIDIEDEETKRKAKLKLSTIQITIGK